MMEKLFHSTGVDSTFRVEDLQRLVEPALFYAGIANDSVANEAIAEVLEWFDVNPDAIRAYVARREGDIDAARVKDISAIYQDSLVQKEAPHKPKEAKKAQRQMEVDTLLKRMHDYHMAFNWHPIDFVLRSDYLKSDWSTEQFGSIFKSLIKFYEIKQNWYDEYKRLMKKRRKFRMNGIPLSLLYQDESDGALDGLLAHIYGEPCKGLRDVSIDDPYKYERFLEFEKEHQRPRKGRRSQKSIRQGGSSSETSKGHYRGFGLHQHGEAGSSALSQPLHDFPLPLSWRQTDTVDVPMHGLTIHQEPDHEGVLEVHYISDEDGNQRGDESDGNQTLVLVSDDDATQYEQAHSGDTEILHDVATPDITSAFSGHF